MPRILAIFVLGLCFGIGLMAVYRAFESDEAAIESDANAAATPRHSVVALGTLEPRDGVVQVSSPLIGYQVKQVNVQEGQSVKAGEVLIELDPAVAEAEHQLALSQRAEALERQQAEINLAKERIATAELSLKQTVDGRQLELDAQQSRIDVAEANQLQAEKDLERLKELHKLNEPLAAQQQVEHQQLMLDSATAEHEAAKVALKRLEQSLTFQQQTAEAELRTAQQSLTVAEKGTGVESLNRRVEMAELKLKQTKITASTVGVVLNVLTHPGEVVAQQPLLQIADLDNLVCAAEVDAGEVPYIQANHKATIGCRAFQNATLDGTVDRVGNQITQATLRPLDPRRPVDRNVTKVIVLVDAKKAARLINTSGKDRRAALVGLQVEVTFPLAQ